MTDPEPPKLTQEDLAQRRLKECVENWPFAMSGEYNPSCCRWPKSCSPHGLMEAVEAGNLTEDDLEPKLHFESVPVLASSSELLDEEAEDDDEVEFRKLLVEAESVLSGIKEQLDQFLAESKKMGIRPTERRNSDGSMPFLDLLMAKSTALSVVLELRENLF